MLEEFMLSIGFDEKQIQRIQKIYPPRAYSPSTLLYNIRNLYNFFRRNGVHNSEFVEMIVTIPNILFISIENIKTKIQELKEVGFQRLDAFYIVKNYPYLLDFSYLVLKQKMDEFESLGFRHDQVVQIMSKYPHLFREDFSVFRKRFIFFLEYGYSLEETIRILVSSPELFGSSLDLIQNKILDFKNMGFQEKDIIRITSILPSIFFHDVNLLHKQFQYLLDFGYNELDIIHVVQKIPILLKEDYLGFISNHVECLVELGFTKKDVIFLTCNNPYLFLYSTDNLISKFNAMKELGYRDKDVVSILKDAPILFGYDIHNIKKKYLFFQSIQLEHYLIAHGMYFTYNFDVIQARYHYLSKNDSLKNHYHDLFLMDDDFYKKYHVKKRDLLRGDS